MFVRSAGLGQIAVLDTAYYSGTSPGNRSGRLVGKGTSSAAKESKASEGSFDDLWGMEYLEGEEQAYLRAENYDTGRGSTRDQGRDQLQEDGLWEPGAHFF